ncbi:hypothetical protein PYW07_015160 [Mythimna separata]|uniref:TIL domain-containing protein n=1 Tax=Mythimna separata TaxID=271217 RepID=A0AAD7YYY9_MYTSE|nr:hypothetical protein PYW07_015160 [Mythimna separata]
MFRFLVLVACCVVLCVGDKVEPKCGENEEYTDCKESCPPEVCFSIVAFFDCSKPEPCTKGCACKPGFLRKESDSPCVPMCKCPEIEYSSECLDTPSKAKEQA